MSFRLKRAKSLPIYATLLLFTIGFAGFANAVFVEERLADPVSEERARNISEGIRCLVCQNQSIMDSNAGLAKDLRGIVRERVLAGDSDDQVRQFLVSRYGDWVLLNPPFKMQTLVLWLAPFVVLIFGGFLMIRFLRRKSADQIGKPPSEPLSTAEMAELDKLIAEDDSKRGQP